MLSKETKDQIAREAEEYSDVWHDYETESNWEIEQKSYIAGAETWAERGEMLKEALEALNKELDYYWNSSRTISSRKSMPETIKRAICAAQKECAQAASNFNNPVK